MRCRALSVAVPCVLLLLAGCNSQEGAKSLPEPVGDTQTSAGPPSGSLPPNHPPIDVAGSAPDAAADRRLPPGVQNPMAEIMALKARVEKNPKDVEALIALGNANMMISRFEAAQELYSRVLAIQPKNLDVR
ncbi:MAG: hypothetical protein ABIO65_11590, partial [Nitrospiria bacterium]